MNIEDVKTRVEEVRRLSEDAHDYEMAHISEDALRRDVLRAIAYGAPNARALARAALPTDSLKFARWYA